jgi:hypothetical protein
MAGEIRLSAAILDGYVIAGIIGAGGMGIAYRAMKEASRGPWHSGHPPEIGGVGR